MRLGAHNGDNSFSGAWMKNSAFRSCLKIRRQLIRSAMRAAMPPFERELADERELDCYGLPSGCMRACSRCGPLSCSCLAPGRWNGGRRSVSGLQGGRAAAIGILIAAGRQIWNGKAKSRRSTGGTGYDHDAGGVCRLCGGDGDGQPIGRLPLAASFGL